ncbi:Mfs1.2 [Trametes versicolor FP-101664 SS1]|uniref:Mfs1.2 n=1 Tax=Trametes versicolor (strain FP-101664) TaxID=717944 RepID=UPI0004623044|nr:Mfs1.2 [Trametes versicolor FP-101664 SS1]EIW57953.1 Mfs1.2 [Trametes versicolor FP-101664 SS1]
MDTPKEANVLEVEAQPNDDAPQSPGSSKKGLKFWLIILSLCLSIFLSALELTAVSTALPVIIHDLQGGDFVWVGTAYSLASTAFLPLSGGVAEIFGRRIAMFFSLSTFILGSALCGAAQNMNWLIAARAVQGLGGGGILSVVSIIMADLVPLKERGLYNGLTGMTWAVSSAIGPLVGGALATRGQWRWLFYLNLPICGAALVMVTAFLKLPTPPGNLASKLGRMDWFGNLLIIASTTSIVVGLTWGGVQFAWSSAHVLAPLIVGLCGIVFFFIYEAYWARNPIVPMSLLQNRTSVSGYIQTFINPIVVLAVAYYLPVYYQACKDATPLRSAVDMLGLSLSMGPIIIISSISVTVLRVYRTQHWIGWAIFMVGMGIFTTLDADAPLAHAIGLPLLLGAGAGIIYAVTYFPVLSPLPVSENAHALAFFAFCRSFAGIWGIAIGASVLQNELSRRLPPALLAELGTGVDLSYASIPQIPTLAQPLKDEVRHAFGDSLVVVWQVMLGILGIGFVASLLMRDVPMHGALDDKWALELEADRQSGAGEIQDELK